MSIGLDWINDVAEWVGDLIPEWDLLPPTEGGIKFRPGGVVKPLKPGHIYWYWPATTKVVTIEIKRQTLSFNQRLTTKDDVTISVNTVIVFEIDDVHKALVDTNDFEDTIGEVSQKLTVQPIMSREFEEIRRDMAESNEMRNELTRGARSVLAPYGVRVLDTYMSDFTETRVFSHEGSGLAIEEDDDG
jgi:regulator of protease activity HflC (stomatin/prohibitin superfamily)